MSTVSTLEDLVGADLSAFRIVEMFGAYSLNEFGMECGLPELFENQ
jgi:hypothetical protein